MAHAEEAALSKSGFLYLGSRVSSVEMILGRTVRLRLLVTDRI